MTAARRAAARGGDASGGAPVLCFGEALWDSLPAGLFPGGAPYNVAYHLARCGAPAAPVTAVGDDALGRELLGRMRAHGVDTRWVAVLPDRATGVGRADLAPDGSARYAFGDDAAWDRIPVPPALARLAARAPVVIFGTLSQRGAHNGRALAALLAAARGARRVYDVNLRPPHDEPALVWRLAAKADILKVNDDELRSLAGVRPGPPEPGVLERLARALARAAGCPRVCVTAGARGAGLLWRGAWHWEHGLRVRVDDTVGAGDAFLARLIHALLVERAGPERALQRACRLGEFVAASSGATPAYRMLPNGTPEPHPASRQDNQPPHGRPGPARR